MVPPEVKERGPEKNTPGPRPGGILPKTLNASHNFKLDLSGEYLRVAEGDGTCAGFVVQGEELGVDVKQNPLRLLGPVPPLGHSATNQLPLIGENLIFDG